MLADAHQHSADERAGGQIERLLGGFFEVLPRSVFPFALRQLAELDQRQFEKLHGFDKLDWSSINCWKTGPEDLVAINDAVERTFQRMDMHISSQAQGGCDMIGGTPWFELIDEPEALLGK